jgi:WD40 repeat protein
MNKFFVSFLLVIIFISSFNDAVSKEKPEVFVQIGHSARITSVIITPDGKNIISSSYDKTIKIWDVDKQIIKKTIDAHTARINQIAISPDGKFIASASDDKSIKLWPLNKESEGIKCSEHPYSSDTVAFSPDGKYLISSGTNELKTLVWDISAKKLFKSLDNNYSYEGIKISLIKNFLFYSDQISVYLI